MQEKSRGAKDQLLIDKMILHDCRKRHTNLGIAWIDYKVYDMVPHSWWILESLELVQMSDNILEYLKKINGKLANRVDLIRRKSGKS